MLELLGIEVDGEPVKRERPDFLLPMRDGRTVGVEVVRAIDERIAVGRGARERLKRKLRDALAAAGINAWVNVRLHEHIAAALNGDRNALEREVAALVELARKTMSAGPEGRWYWFEWIDHEFEQCMGRRRHAESDAQDLQGTGVERAHTVGIHTWDEPSATWSTFGGGQRANIVQDAINSKLADLPAYRQCGASEIWLLVVGSTGTGGSLFIDDVEDVVFTSPYDQTIFLELFEGRCMVLNTGTQQIVALAAIDSASPA